MCFKINNWNNEQRILTPHQEQVVIEQNLGTKRKKISIYFKNTKALGEPVFAKYNNCMLHHYSCFSQHKYKIRPFWYPITKLEIHHFVKSKRPMIKGNNHIGLDRNGVPVEHLTAPERLCSGRLQVDYQSGHRRYRTVSIPTATEIRVIIIT